jgi:hypothetical protein
MTNTFEAVLGLDGSLKCWSWGTLMKTVCEITKFNKNLPAKYENIAHFF